MTVIYIFIAAFVGILIGLWIADIYHDINDKWISVDDDLPEILETVWITNGKGWVSLGCIVVFDYDNEDKPMWCWGEHNGTIYAEGDSIVAECEAEDLDVKYWKRLPKLPKL